MKNDPTKRARSEHVSIKGHEGQRGFARKTKFIIRKIISKKSPKMLHFPLSILAFFVLCFAAIEADKLRVLIISPGSKLMATHFQWHSQIAHRIGQDPEIEPFVEEVYLLGLTESEKESKTKVGKVTIWKHNRLSATAKTKQQHDNQFISDNPMGNVWRKHNTFLPSDDAGANLHFLDFVTKNEKLMDELNKLNFNVGIMENIALDELPMGIFHFLPSIRVTLFTSSVMPTITHYDLLGYKKIVNKIPGLNTAHAGIHKDVASQKFGEIRENNENWIKIIKGICDKTYAHWYVDLHESKNAHYKKHASSLPRMEKLFDQAKFFLVNYQPMIDYVVVEQQVNSHHAHTGPKLEYIGGIGLLSGNGEEVEVKQKLQPETSEIFAKGPVVLVSLGSVVELGVVPAKHSENDPAMDEMVKDNEAKKEAFLEVFKAFEHFNEKHVQFIMKYGKKTEQLAAQPYIQFPPNVYGKGWLEQAAILAHKPAAFISHCGANSVLEALAFGVPLICIPFFGDQFNNAEALASRKMAVVIDVWDDLRDESNQIDPKKEHENEKFKQALKEALREVLGQEGEKNIYRENMEKAREQFLEANPVKNLRKVFKEIHEILLGQNGGHSPKHGPSTSQSGKH